jgi:hypothetical protein
MQGLWTPLAELQEGQQRGHRSNETCEVCVYFPPYLHVCCICIINLILFKIAFAKEHPRRKKIKPTPIKALLCHGRMKLQLLLCPFHHQGYLLSQYFRFCIAKVWFLSSFPLVVKPWRVLVQRENMLTLVLKLPKGTCIKSKCFPL